MKNRLLHLLARGHNRNDTLNKINKIASGLIGSTTMFGRFVYRSTTIILAVFSVAMLVSCEVGLGESVDVQAPTLSITYPEIVANSTTVVRDSFYVAGVCKDDKEIKNVILEFKDLNGNDQSVTAELYGNNRWRAELNKPYRDANGDIDLERGYNGWPLGDGSYVIKATAYDKVGNKSGTSSIAIDIDNTPPLFIVSKPGVLKESNNYSNYGTVFKVEGTLFDIHQTGLSMTVTIFDENGNIVGKEDGYVEDGVETAGGTSVQFARYIQGLEENNKQDVNKNYDIIFFGHNSPSSVEIANAETKKYSCEIKVSDSAKIYKNPPSDGNSRQGNVHLIEASEGNATTKLYLYDSIYDKFLSAKGDGIGVTTSELNSMLNKTNRGDENGEVVIQATQKTVKVQDVISDLAKIAQNTDGSQSKSKTAAFTLNPNTAPTYNVTGLSDFETVSDETLDPKSNASNGYTISITAQAGLDDVNISPDTFKVWLLGNGTRAITKTDLITKINALTQALSDEDIDNLETQADYDAKIQQIQTSTGFILLKGLGKFGPTTPEEDARGEGKYGSFIDDVWTPGGSEAQYTFGTKITVSLTQGSFYYVVLTGQDRDSVDFSQSSYYGFKGFASGTPPQLKIKNPSDDSFFKSSDDVVVSGSVKAMDTPLSEFQIKVTSKNKSNQTLGTVTVKKNKESGAWVEETGKISGITVNEATDTWSFSLNGVTNYNQVKTLQNSFYLFGVDVKVSTEGGQSADATVNFNVDTTPPAFNTAYIKVSGSDKQVLWSAAQNNWFKTNSIRIQGEKDENNENNCSLKDDYLDKIEIYVDSNDGNGLVLYNTITAASKFDTTINFGNEPLYNIKLKAFDKAGNYCELTSQIHIDTVSPPLPTLSVPSGDEKYNNVDKTNNKNITITIQASDNANGSGIAYYVLKKPGSASETQTAWSTTSSGGAVVINPSVQFTVTPSDIKTGDNEFKVYVIDKAGNKSETQSIVITADFVAPTVTIIEPTVQTVYKTVQFKGRASDESGIKTKSGKFEYKIGNGAWVTEFDSSTLASGATDSLAVDQNNEWNYSFDTWAIPALKTKTVTDLTVRATFTDNNGNTATTAEKAFKVDQDKDRPTIKFMGIKADGTTSTREAVVAGSITDDDGITELWYQNVQSGGTPGDTAPVLPSRATVGAKSNGWTLLATENGDWSVDLKKITGVTPNQNWYFYTKDKNGTVFKTENNQDANISTALSGIYIKDQTTSSSSKGSEPKSVSFFYDENPPISAIFYMGKNDSTVPTWSDGNWKSATDIKPTFGANVKLFVRVKVQENERMDAESANGPVTVLLGGVQIPWTTSRSVVEHEETKDGKTNKIYEYIFGPKELNDDSVNSGSIILSTSVQDSAGNPSSATANILIDKNPPKVAIYNPQSNPASKIIGSVDIRGTVQDDEGSSIKAIKWAIPLKNNDTIYADKNARPANVTTENYWHDTTAWTTGNQNWTIQFQKDGTDTSESILWYIDQGVYRTTETFTNSNIYKIPIWFYAEDSAGNAGNPIKTDSLGKELCVYADPDAGKPTPTILSPTEGMHTSGIVNISGTAVDTDGTIKKVLVRINDEDEANAREAELTSISTWKYEYNSGITSGSTSTSVTVSVKAIDNGDNDRGWTPPVTFYIDPNAPEISTPKIMQFGNSATVPQVSTSSAALPPALVSKDYEDYMYISGNDANISQNGQWYFVVDVSNDHGSSQSDGNISQFKFNQISGGNINCNWSNIDTTSKNSKTITLAIPITTQRAAGVGDNGIVAYRMEVSNANDNPTSSQMTIRINVDSTPPALTNKTDGKVRIRANPPSNMDDAKDDTIIGENESEAKIINSNNWTTVGDVLKEKDSGLDFVAVSFVGDRSGTKKVYQPMVSGGNATPKANETVINSTTPSDGKVYMNSDGLPALYLTNVTRSATNAITASAISGKNQIHKNSLVKISGKYYFVESVSGTTVTLTEPCPVSQKTVEFIFAQTIDNQSKESQNPDNSVDSATDDGDAMWEEIRPQGENYQWRCMFNSCNIPDGPVTINIIAVDKAGNLTKGSVSTQVQNNRPRIAKVLLGTDLNGNGFVDFESAFSLQTDPEKTDSLSYSSASSNNGKEFGEFNYYSTLSNEGATRGEALSNATVDAHDFKVLDELCILPEFVGGNGDIKYIMKTADNETPEITTFSTGTGSALKALTTKTSLTSGATKKVQTISGSQRQIADEVSEKGGVVLSVKNGTTVAVKNYIALTFWDSTEGLTPGSSDTKQASQKAFLKLHVNILANEKNKPTAKITPFYWKSKDDNSVYIDETNGTLQGHIEFENDLTFTGSQFTQTSDEMDRDPKVSGKIKIEGELFDDVRLGTLSWDVGNFDNMGIDFATYEGGEWTYSDNYNPDTGSYSAGGDLASAMASGLVWYKVEDVSITQAGHKAKYTIVLDTEKVTGVAASDCAVTVTANDWQSNENASSEIQTAVTYDANGNILTDSRTPYYKMDVVPYITGIETPIRNKSGLKNSNIRSASGKYSVIKGNTSNAIEISGWNFSSSAITNLIHGSSPLELSKNIANAHKIVVSNNISNSGYVEVTVNSMTSLNNKNNNDSKGLYKNTANKVANYQNMPNRECDAYETKNILLNDDRYLRVFDMKDTGTKNGYYPVMIMDGNDPVFAYDDLNGCHDDTSAGTKPTYQPNDFAPQRRKYNGSPEDVISGGVTISPGKAISTEYLAGGFSWDQMAMAKDAAGKYYHVAVTNDKQGYLHLFYDKYASLYNKRKCSGYTGSDGDWHFNSSVYDCVGWASGTPWSDYSHIKGYGEMSIWSGNNALTFDGNQYGGLLIDRYQYPKLVVKGDSTTSAGATVYMAYYDDQVGKVCFRNFKIGTGSLSNAMYGSTKTNVPESTDSRQEIDGNATKHFAMGVTSDNHVVVVWYDESEGKLVLKYSTDAIDGSNPTNTTTTTTTTNTFIQSKAAFPSYVGQYVSMFIDSSNRIHIAAFDAKDGDLSYLYLPEYNSTALQYMTVDATSNVGNWTQIKVKEGNNVSVPYISYYNSTETGSCDSIKLAFANGSTGNIQAGVDENGYTTGNWEYMTVPAITAPQGGNPKFQNVCLDFDTSGTPVVGYLGTNLEFGKWLGE